MSVATKTRKARASRAELDAILDIVIGFVRSVPYRVSARWAFYRLLQDGHVTGKEAYGWFLWLTGQARKEFRRRWRPDTLEDDTWAVIERGWGYLDHRTWLRALPLNVHGCSDRWKYQPNYVLVLYEAAAMSGQFDHYLPPFVSRCAFKGDVSIPTNWDIAQHIAAMRERYGKPVKVVYFGDLDPKGMQIPLSALADVRAWASPEFEWVRAGLNEGDDDVYDIPENPEKPGTYQWEALDDEQAGTLITESLEQFLDVAGASAAEDEEDLRVATFHGWWREYGPSLDDLDDLCLTRGGP